MPLHHDYDNTENSNKELDAINSKEDIPPKKASQQVVHMTRFFPHSIKCIKASNIQDNANDATPPNSPHIPLHISLLHGHVDSVSNRDLVRDVAG